VFEAAPAQQPDLRPLPFQSLVTGPNATAADSVFTVAGLDALWPLSVMCRLTTSAAVGVRQVSLEYVDADGVRFLVAGMPNTQADGSGAGVPAATTQSFCWYPEAGVSSWPIEDCAVATLPQQHLFPGQKLVLHVWNVQAGDLLDQVRISARFDPL
jgi:hypothetical protein